MIFLMTVKNQKQKKIVIVLKNMTIMKIMIMMIIYRRKIMKYPIRKL